jgi:hypothetical protein
MSVAKKLPIDDVLREFRIRALTTPPEAIEMTNLDREMSRVLSTNNVPKEMKMKMYNEVLNQFRNVRNLVMHVEPPDLEPKKERVWNFTNAEDREDLFAELKSKIKRHLPMNDTDVFVGTKQVGTANDVKNALEYFLNMDPSFFLNKPKDFVKQLNPQILQYVGDVALDLFNDLNVSKSYWKKFFPRLDMAMQPSFLGGSPAKQSPMKLNTRIPAKQSPAKLKDQKPSKITKLEVSPVVQPISPTKQPVAANTRSKHLQKKRSSQLGKGRPKQQSSSYEINFKKWNDFLAKTDGHKRMRK